MNTKTEAMCAADNEEPSADVRKVHIACLWSGALMVVLLFLGSWPIAGFIPPHHPWSTAAEIAEIYRTDTLSIRLGLALSFLSITLILPFGAAIAIQTRRIEGDRPILSYIQIAAFSSGTMAFVVPWISWLTAAFRPERADTEIYLLSDFGWIFFVTFFIMFSAWNIAIGVAILIDQRKVPIFPRWLGYFNIFVAISFVPDICTPFFKNGPFSWEGIFPFWIPYAVYFVWIWTQMFYTHKAIMKDPALLPR